MKQTFVQDISQQLKSAVFSSGITTKLICLFSILGYILSFNSKCVQILAVIPGRIMPPNFWIWLVCLIHLHIYLFFFFFFFFIGHLLHIVLLNCIFGIQ